jgi:hypothetical protein
MARAEEQLDRYRETVVALKRADNFSPEAGAAQARTYAAFSVGYLMGAGIPEAAAALAHLFRRAYPGESFPILWEGEA